MRLSIIVAMDQNRVIGVDNRLPWHLPEDLKRFKALTLGHSVIMGRKTFESIGKPLPGRTNIVVTRRKDFTAKGCTVVHSLEDALAAVQQDSEPFLIGGGELFELGLPRAAKIYVTRVEIRVPKGDVFFPELGPEWEIFEEEPHKGFTYVTYTRQSGNR